MTRDRRERITTRQTPNNEGKSTTIEKSKAMKPKEEDDDVKGTRKKEWEDKGGYLVLKIGTIK